MSTLRSILDYLINVKRDYVRQGLTTSAPKIILGSGEHFTFNYSESHRCSLNRFGQPKSLELWIPEGSLADKLDSFRSAECDRVFEYVRVKKLSRVLLSEGDIDVQATAEALMNKLKARESALALAS